MNAVEKMAEAYWNATTDEYNQWDTLDETEMAAQLRAMRATLAAIEAEGFVIVPKEPTVGMMTREELITKIIGLNHRIDKPIIEILNAIPRYEDRKQILDEIFQHFCGYCGRSVPAGGGYCPCVAWPSEIEGEESLNN